MQRIQVDHTLPAAQFNAELLAASRLARIEANLQHRRAQEAEEGFRRMGYTEEAVRELVAIHVFGVAQ